jgi:uncharacterized glyoxalase superfamily protein PhnB
MTTPRQSLIPILVYSDIASAHDFLVERFGFDSGGLHRDDEGQVDHGEVWLHRVLPEFGLTSPKTHGASTGMLAVVVDDVDGHHARLRSTDTAIESGPADQPYGFREYSAHGPEGELWSFMTPLH